MSGSDETEMQNENAEAEAEANSTDGGEEAVKAEYVPRELTEEEELQLAQLDEDLANFESAKRWSDYIRTLVAKAELVQQPEEKVALYAQAGEEYITRSSNQAEAIKCFEQVLEFDPNHAEAMVKLREMYEKRRDWESLIGVMKRQAELMDPMDQPLMYVEMAELATQRLRKPEICIELWELVRETDPENPNAIEQLTALYERARQWEPLADVLEKKVESISDEKELAQALQKLGMLYADKIGDDEGAMRAFQQLLALDPNDRRAQEQLKKRYIALQRWDELEDFYATTEKWDELIRVLEREADNKDLSDEERIALLFRAARLWDERNGKPDRAARALEKVLAIDEANLDAADKLIPIYESAGDPKKLVAVYEVRLQHLDDPAEKVAMLREAALLYEERLRNPKTALERFISAFLEDPTTEILREDVARLSEKVRSWQDAIEAYKLAIEANSDDPGLQTDLRMLLGGILQANGATEDAIAQYKAVYDEQIDHAGAIEALQGLYRETNDFAALLDVCERRMELEQDMDARRAIAYERAGLFRDELADADKAIEAYTNILVEYGDHEADAYGALDALYQQQERWEELAETLTRRIDLGPESTEALAALKFRLGQVRAAYLDDAIGAIELYHEVVTLTPDHTEGREALEAFMDQAAAVEGDEGEAPAAPSDASARAAAILEPLYEEQGHWARLVQAIGVLHDASEDPAERLAYLTKMGEVYGSRMGDAERTFQTFAAALRGAPDSEETLGRLELLAVEQERFKDLVSLLNELAGGVDDPDLSRRLFIKSAEISDVQVGDVDGAVAAYSQILEKDAADLDVLGALEALYRRTERWRDLLGVLRRRVEATADPVDQEELLSQMASIHAEMLEEPLEAISRYKELLEIDPANYRALAALDALYESQEAWSDLADNVDRRLGMASDPEDQIALMVRLSQLREQRMGAVDAAIEGYREVLDREPTNGPALEALERLLQAPEHQALIADILEPLYRDANEYQKLVDVLEIQAALADSPERRVELLHQIAELHEVALEDLGAAFDCFARALSEDPASETTQDNLDRLAAASANFAALAGVYEARVEGMEDPQLAAHLYVKAAQVREEQLGDVERAIAHYTKVVELDPEHLEAATSLERLYQVAERYQELALILRKKASMLSSLEDQKAHLFRAASIYEELLEQPEAAIGVYNAVLEADPEELEAMDKLVELFLRLEKWDELLAVYARKADIVMDPEEKKRIYVEMGAVYEREVGDVAKAIDTYQRILEIDPDELTAIQRLDALYQATENWSELMSVLEREADLSVDPNETISYRYRIAELWHHRLNDAPRAVEIYRDILEVMSDHEPTIEALRSMIEHGLEPMGAANVLEPIYRQSGDAAALVGVHEVQFANEEDPVRRVELLHQIAELHEFQLDQARPAFDALSRAVPLDAENEHTLASLERLAENLGAFAEVTTLYDKELERAAEAGEAHLIVDLGVRTAQLYEVQVGDVDRAIARYQSVVAVEDTHVGAIESLDRLFEATERWAELADILRKEMAIAPSPDDILNLQFRLGHLYQEQLGQVDQAIEQYREILNAAPEHAQSMHALEMLFADGVQPLVIGEILEPLYRMQEAYDRLLNVQEIQLQYLEDPIERVATMHRLAELAEDRAMDAGRASVWMQRALLEDPGHDHSQVEVERLAQATDGWGQLANTYADVLVTTQESEPRVLLGKRLARVYAEELGDVVRAEETYRYLLGIEPAEEEVLEALDQIYTEHGAFEALAEVLQRRASGAAHEDDQVDFSHRLGHVLEHDLQRGDEAIAVYNRILSDLNAEHHETIHALQGIYTNREDWPNLYAALERELQVAFGDVEQAEILAKMARLASDALGDLDKATELWKKVLDLRGEDPGALNALGDIYARQENWRDLVEVLEREVSVSADDDSTIAMYADLGRIWYEKLGRERNALDSWERVLDIDPVNTSALFAMAEIHRAASRHTELVDTLNRVIEVGAATLEEATLEHVYMQLGFLYAKELQQPMDAVDSYNRAVELNPRNFKALDALETIHREESQWEDCIGVLEQRVLAFEEPADKITGLLAVAAMWAEQGEDADRGTSAYQRILQIDPLHRYAFQRLDELHRAAERWEDLIEMFVERVESTEDIKERIVLLRMVAQVYEQQLGEANEAFDALIIAWGQDYTDRKTADELERVAASTNKWNDLLNTANAALQGTTDSQVKIALCLSCAKWYGQELGHPEYAIPYYEEILKLDPSNVPAMRQRTELYRSTQQWQQLAQALGQLVEMTRNPVERSEVFVQMGDLCQERLGIPDQAGTYYTKALDEDKNNVAAIDALDRIHQAAGDYRALLDMRTRKVAALRHHEQDPIAALLKVAETHESKLNDIESAIGVYREVLELDDVNEEALQGLSDLYEAESRWPELREVLERKLDIANTERERIATLMRLARMWEEEFVKNEKAAECLEQVLDIDAQHEDALISLERLYHQMQKWEDLLNTFERHVDATPDRAQKVSLLKRMGTTYATELQADDQAIDAYIRAIDLNDSDLEALDELTRLYDKRGEHAAALEMMEKMAALSTEPEQQVDLRFRMGALLDQQLGDRHSALEHFQSAIDIEPGHLPSLEAMRNIQIDMGDWLAAAKVLRQETEYQENPRLKAKLLVQLGEIYAERLDEAGAALDAFETAYREDADNEEAALPLAEHYYETERWEDAYPLLDMLVKRSARREPDEQHRLAFMLGQVAGHVGKDEEAVKALSKAYQLDSHHLPSLLELAAAYYRMQDWEKAFKYYQMLLVHHRDSLGREEITDIFYRLGVIKREQNERRKALNMFDKALEEDEYHRPTLQAVIGLYADQHEWEQVIHFKKQILEVADGDDERFSILEAIGDHWKDDLSNLAKAIESYVDASDIKPDDHRVLHKLLAAYQSTGQWELAIGCIERISDLDERVAAKSKYAYTVGVITRDELKDPEGAIERFNQALDLDGTQLKAFEAINKLLTQKKDWKQLERAFRKMLHRVVAFEKKNPELEFNLWHNLGIIYRDRQQNHESAAEAFKMASRLQPDNATEHQILAELFATIPERVHDAIEEHQWLLSQDPYRVDSYRALYRLYFDARQYDKAWCLSATLAFLKKADDEQQQFYEQYRTRGMIRPQSRLDNERWLKDVFHPQEDRYVSKMMEALAAPVHAAKASTDRALGLLKKHEVDPFDEKTTATFAKTFGFCAQVLSIVPTPRLFLRQDAQVGLGPIVGSSPPASLCGATLLSGFSPNDLAFVIGRHLAYYRPEHFMRTMVASHTELKTLLVAGLRIAGLGAADPQVDAYAQQLAGFMQQQQVDVLRAVARKFLDAGAQTDLKRWMQCVELSACRAGFVLCNDLETAARMIQSLPAEGTADLPPKDKVKEVVLFSVSEEYFRIREALGISIKV